jgi:hypothetical protein
MTEKSKKPKPTPLKYPPQYKRESYDNDLGIPQVVLIPLGESDKTTGIPLSLDLSPLFGHMPASFQKALTTALHAQGLIEPADYFKPGAAERYQRAMRTVLKHDFLSIQALAKQEL